MSRDLKPTAVVIGPYRVHNFGDDLVGAIIVSHLKRCGYRVLVPRLGQRNTDWLGIEHTEEFSCLDEADTVVVGGGGIMSDTAGAVPGAEYLQIVADAALEGRLADKKVYVTSVGAGPWVLEESKLLAFGVSLLADKVGVRDRESREHLERIGITGSKVIQGADCALLGSDYLDFASDDNGLIGVQFKYRQYEDVRENPHVDTISALIDDYANRNSENVLLLSNGPAKAPQAKVAEGARTLEYGGLASYLPAVAGLKTMFTSHLHLAITAYSQRIPTCSVYVREKTRRFYEQIGHPERAIDLRTARPEDVHDLLDSLESMEWTPDDEKRLQLLQDDARLLLDFVR